ncbi:MAG: hypothetical protein ACLP22_19870 [Solirubrobacteraceae bacterium]
MANKSSRRLSEQERAERRRQDRERLQRAAEQTLAHLRALGRHAQRMAERVALGTKLYQGLAPVIEYDA